MKVTHKRTPGKITYDNARDVIKLLKSGSPYAKKVIDFATQTKRTHARDFKRSVGTQSGRSNLRSHGSFVPQYKMGRLSHYRKDLKNDCPTAVKTNPINKQIFNNKGFIDDGGQAQKTKWVAAFADRSSLLDIFAADQLYRIQDVVGQATLVPPISQQTADKLWIESIDYEIYFTNHCALPIEMDIYDMHALEDTSVNPESAISSGLIRDGSTDSVVQATLDTWGFRPNDSLGFKDLFHIDGSQKVMMESGGTHKHIGKIDIQKYCDFNDLTQSIVTFKNKFTKLVMLTIKAFPVHIDEAPATAAVSACPFRVDLFTNYSIKWRRVNMPKKKQRFIANDITQLPGPYAYQQEDATPVPVGLGEV